MRKITLIAFLFVFAIPLSAQVRERTSAKTTMPVISSEIRSTPAFAELLLRRVELESELEELNVSYTDEFPKVRRTRFELTLIETELSKISKTPKPKVSRLTLALGKLLVRRTSLATDFWVVSNRYSDDHPSVKKAKKRMEIFSRAIDDILKD